MKTRLIFVFGSLWRPGDSSETLVFFVSERDYEEVREKYVVAAIEDRNGDIATRKIAEFSDPLKLVKWAREHGYELFVRCQLSEEYTELLQEG